MAEPHWATQKDAFGNSRGRYSFRGRRVGWSCHHCGGLFRGLPKLLEHQEKVLNAVRENPVDVEQAGLLSTKNEISSPNSPLISTSTSDHESQG